jgi:hypothetical protein
MNNFVSRKPTLSVLGSLIRWYETSSRIRDNNRKGPPLFSTQEYTQLVTLSLVKETTDYQFPELQQ